MLVWHRLGLLLLSLLWATVGYSQDICAAPQVNVAQHAQMLQVRGGASLTPNEVIAYPSEQLRPVTTERYLGNHNANRWLRLQVHHSGIDTCTRWLRVGPAWLRYVDVYLPNETGWQKMQAGPGYPFNEWPAGDRRPVFPVTIAPGNNTILVNTISTGEAVSFHPVLWAPVAFQQADFTNALSDGITYGLLFLLVLISVCLSLVFRRGQLSLMAVSVLFYIGIDAAQKNYLLKYWWPGSPMLDRWAIYFFAGIHFLALFAYLFALVRVHRLGRWKWLFYLPWLLFIWVAFAGGLISNSAYATFIMLGPYQGLLWMLMLLHLGQRITGRDRRWFPLLFLGALCFRSITTFAPLLGINLTIWGGDRLAVPKLVALGVMLLAILLREMHQQRQQQMHSNAALAKQRATEKKRLEQLVAERTEALNEALATRRLLLARVGHDLRSPLTGVLDSVRLWQQGDKRRNYPELIEKQVRQQEMMINELLEFSRSDLNDITIEPTPDYLHRFLADINEQAELVCERYSNHYRYYTQGLLPATVWLDFNRLWQVLNNLITNAAKFTQQGKVSLIVACTPAARPGQVVLHFTVADTGMGISPELQRQVLAPFRQGETGVAQDGVGLGLYIVSQLLKMMGSQLHIHSRPNQGSCFTFELTAQVAEEAEVDVHFHEVAAIAIDGNNQAVLVVDDLPEQRDMLCDLLNGYGFDTQAAANGREAQALAQQQHFALVITDQQMPLATGNQLLLWLREHQPQVPVLLYSALPPDPNATQGHSFDAALFKSTDSTPLLQEIVRLLNSAPA